MTKTVSEVPGVLVGHWTNLRARTGCTAIVFPPETVASGEVRGGAPASREFELLKPQRLVQHVDAVMLTGGSAFGLSACDGLVDWLVDQERGFSTTAGPVPIVVGLALFDLLTGDGTVRPNAAAGRHAAETAASGFDVGRVGAGTGATAGKWRGPDSGYDAGFGSAVVTHEDVVVQAFVAVNPAGDIDDGSIAPAIADGSFSGWPAETEPAFSNTTIGVIVTNAALSKGECRLIAEGGHDGYARAIFPPHRRTDGDAVVAAATGAVPADCDVVRALAVVAMAEAITSTRS